MAHDKVISIWVDGSLLKKVPLFVFLVKVVKYFVFLKYNKIVEQIGLIENMLIISQAKIYLKHESLTNFRKRI